jgi:Flp pilus assembly protein TadD
MSRARASALALAAAAGLAGCAGLLPNPALTENPQASEPALYLDAVRALIAKGQHHAAIAHIEQDRRQHGDTAALRLLEADARRHLGQNKSSEALYQGVLREDFGGPLAAQARHGLGLLYAPVNLDAAAKELREAVKLAPTNADYRNDLGYALLQRRRFSDAHAQLATANELAPSHIAARNNLLILYFAQGNEAAAQRLAAAAQVDAPLLARLKAQAQSLRTPPPAPRAVTPAKAVKAPAAPARTSP